MGVILADSNDIVRAGMRSVLSMQTDLPITSEATNSEELCEQVQSFSPSMVILDFTSEGFTIDVISKIKSINSDIRFIAITPEQNAQTLIDALRLGVNSYVKKNCALDEIVNAVIETSRGNKFFCGQILETIQRAEIDVNHLDFDPLNCEPVILSERENEIIKLVAEGNTNGKIAELLFLSNHTVNTHRKNIMAKLGVKNTAGIVMYAVKMNIVSPNRFLFSPSNG
ncbi:MAG: hypothetical protein CL857_00515 [Cryomorphaceae bacterium]|nr:hypothetical protein [Cryomorphaceae bacterium]|tara:strand:+ start:3529 stop:4206 length:678 start_codon:yes stop_codon:yes gene_type:complete